MVVVKVLGRDFLAIKELRTFTFYGDFQDEPYMANEAQMANQLAAHAVEIQHLNKRATSMESMMIKHSEYDDKRFAEHDDQITDLRLSTTRMLAYVGAIVVLFQVVGIAVGIWAAVK